MPRNKEDFLFYKEQLKKKQAKLKDKEDRLIFKEKVLKKRGKKDVINEKLKKKYNEIAKKETT
jgi:hypothetical protein